jgi:Tat protein translocase TatB subunit
MLNVGPLELLTICVLALVVLGPDRLPQALRQVGRAVGELRRISGGFQDELRRAMDEALDDNDLDDVPQTPSERPAELPPVIAAEEAAGLDLASERADDAEADAEDAVAPVQPSEPGEAIEPLVTGSGNGRDGSEKPAVTENSSTGITVDEPPTVIVDKQPPAAPEPEADNTPGSESETETPK